MVKIIPLVCAAALLASCAARPASQAVQAVPAVLPPPNTAEARFIVKCARLDPSIAAEASTQTSLETVLVGGSPALSAALMASETRKNVALRKAIDQYKNCRSMPLSKSG